MSRPTHLQHKFTQIVWACFPRFCFHQQLLNYIIYLEIGMLFQRLAGVPYLGVYDNRIPPVIKALNGEWLYINF